MLNRYGPWATMIDLGGRPQLSTFWRHRLTMLTPASRTSFVLSRSNLLWLAAAAVLADGPADRPLCRGCNRRGEIVRPQRGRDTERPRKAGGGKTVGSRRIEGRIARERQVGDFWHYHAVDRQFLHSEYRLRRTEFRRPQGDWPDKRAGEAAPQRFPQVFGTTVRGRAEMRKMMETLPPEKREAAFAQYRARLLEVRSAVRKELEQLLSAAQLKELQTIAVGSQGVSRLRYDRALGDRVGLSEEQMKQLLSRMIEGRAARESELRLVDELKKNDEAALALITPQQWKEIENIPTDFPPQFPGPELTQLVNPDTAKKLGLSAEQQVKVNKLLANCIAKAQELQKLVSDINGPRPIEEVAATSRILDRKQQEIKKHDRDEIAAMLTPQQLAGLKQAVLWTGVPQPHTLSHAVWNRRQRRSLRFSRSHSGHGRAEERIAPG